MRKWLVKNFVLDYMFTVFGTTYNAPRASRIIFPIFVITGILVATNPNWPNPTILIWFMYLVTTISLFFGFIYFRIYPINWEELDDFQKFQYGFFKGETLSSEQFLEWLKIKNKFI